MDREYDIQESIKISREAELRKIARRNTNYLLFRKTFYMPISIALKAVAFAAKIIGGVAAIGLPYGVYCCYVVIKQLIDGVPLNEATHTIFLMWFVFLPFISFLISSLSANLAEYLYYKIFSVW
jgi:hypothetical protein